MESTQPVLRAKLKEFFGLSRMRHSVLDVAHPAVVATEKLVGYSGQRECFDPVRFWRLATSRLSFVLACLTILASLVFPFTVPRHFGLISQAGALAAGIVLLVIPGIKRLQDQQTKLAMLFVNRACFYPLAVFVVAAILVIV
jgi:hypothetical protein